MLVLAQLRYGGFSGTSFIVSDKAGDNLSGLVYFSNFVSFIIIIYFKLPISQFHRSIQFKLTQYL
jgi:hypothetical protein